MKKSFSGFYNPTNAETKLAWQSNNTVFIFDTNIFLNLYSYKEETRNDFFRFLSKLKEKIWMPFHVGLEYQMKRLDIIKEAKKVFRDANKSLDDIKELEKSLKVIVDRFPSLSSETEELLKNINNLIDNYRNSLNELDKNQPCVRSHDEIREQLNKLFDGRIGKEPDQEFINNVEKEGEERYKNKLPPGFEDDKKKGEFFYGNVKYQNKFGDLIIWKQIIEYIKENHEINNVIFVTDDSKDDWWFNIESNGKKKIGPHAFLIDEIKRINNVQLFDMYSTSYFLQLASKYYPEEKPISEDSINDVESTNIFNYSSKFEDASKEEDFFESSEPNNQRTEINIIQKAKNKSLLEMIITELIKAGLADQKRKRLNASSNFEKFYIVDKDIGNDEKKDDNE